MPKRIPIAAAKRFGQEQECRQVIVVAWDGERTHVVTWGQTLADCKEAANGGNFVKKALGFPEADCKAEPARAKRQRITSHRATGDGQR